MHRLVWVLFMLIMLSCRKNDNDGMPTGMDFRKEMRDLVIDLASYSRSYDQDFIVIPQNGIELVSSNGETDGPLSTAYVNTINGHGQEDLFYGYDQDDKPTPGKENQYLRSYLDRSKNAGNVVLVTDYCSTHVNMNDAYAQNTSAGYISFAADHRSLDHIPRYPDPIFHENNRMITHLSEVSNFLYLINPENFSSKSAFTEAVTATNYDLLIMDLFLNENTVFTAEEVEQLRHKANGGMRLVICYMSIGEAEDYRYYWKDEWNTHKPAWLDAENPDWEGNYKVKYWKSTWQEILFGNNDSYLKKILDAGFDGVYLDIVDAFEYYE